MESVCFWCQIVPKKHLLAWSFVTMLPGVLLFLLSSAALAYADAGLLSCSGYVHSSVPGLDYSQVEVALFTEHGSKRDATDCAPSSGYFFLPVENQAKYYLKVGITVISYV